MNGREIAASVGAVERAFPSSQHLDPIPSQLLGRVFRERACAKTRPYLSGGHEKTGRRTHGAAFFPIAAHTVRARRGLVESEQYPSCAYF
jgi:hypothetical protein